MTIRCPELEIKLTSAASMVVGTAISSVRTRFNELVPTAFPGFHCVRHKEITASPLESWLASVSDSTILQTVPV